MIVPIQGTFRRAPKHNRWYLHGSYVRWSKRWMYRTLFFCATHAQRMVRHFVCHCQIDSSIYSFPIIFMDYCYYYCHATICVHHFSCIVSLFPLLFKQSTSTAMAWIWHWLGGLPCLHVCHTVTRYECICHLAQHTANIWFFRFIWMNWS